ncbi:MAG TPA: hypothetical protein VN914_10425 [Polyangia bacterium]|nr:hypothetical protein [Polyangia bacterium]
MRSWLVVLVVGLSACLLSGAPAQGKGKKAVDTAECHEDADCVLVTDGCCGCNEGGKQRAIPKKARDNYEKKRKSICKQTMCPQLMSEDQTCVGRAVCKEKTCALGK